MRRPATRSPSRSCARTATGTRSSCAFAPRDRSATRGPSRGFAPWLWRRVAERAKERPEGSYIVSLLEGGPATCARKLGEEGVEAALAGATESDERLVSELADLWFSSYVLLAARGLDPAAVERELARRAR
ncbi:MAG: phosphoribosyl-ATP diphosphatase [Gaiellaceae bacterium]